MVKKGLAISMPGVDVDAQLAAVAAGVVAPAKEEEVKKEAVPEEKPKAEVKEKTKANVKANVNVKKAEPKKEVKAEEKTESMFRDKGERELKTVFMNLRVKESVKADFETLRKELHYSQSDFFELLVAFAKKEIKKQ